MRRSWLLSLLLLPSALFAEDVPSPVIPPLGKPAYRWIHPRVLFDEGHHNVHFLSTGYAPFGRVLTGDGYRVEGIREPFSDANLAGARVLVIVNPRSGGREVQVPERGHPAFTPEECAAVERWVKAGGSLLLVADHYPIGSATQALADQFGVSLSNGFTIDPGYALADLPKSETITFRRDQKRLGDHPILRGRKAKERIDVVETFSGESLRGPRGSSPLLLLSDQAQDEQPPDHVQKISAAGRCQGLALIHGKGRVVVMGEAQALSDIISDGKYTGFGRPGNDNLKLVQNIMHWLTRKL
ncbi:MAG: DUF4350 domain-containing protein [Acidobacteriota bacterium]